MKKHAKYKSHHKDKLIKSDTKFPLVWVVEWEQFTPMDWIKDLVPNYWKVNNYARSLKKAGGIMDETLLL